MLALALIPKHFSIKFCHHVWPHNFPLLAQTKFNNRDIMNKCIQTGTAKDQLLSDWSKPFLLPFDWLKLFLVSPESSGLVGVYWVTAAVDKIQWKCCCRWQKFIFSDNCHRSCMTQTNIVAHQLILIAIIIIMYHNHHFDHHHHLDGHHVNWSGGVWDPLREVEKHQKYQENTPLPNIRHENCDDDDEYDEHDDDDEYD